MPKPLAADYRQTVLTSLQPVADTLRALEHDAESLRAQSEAERTAKDALDITQANYEAGIVSYVSVVTAIDAYQNARIGHIGAVAQRLQDSVALYRGPSCRVSLNLLWDATLR